MLILRRYIARHVIAAIVVVMVVLLGVDLFILFLNEVDDIGHGDYGLWQAILVSVLQLPQFAYQFFPMVALVGSLVGLGALAANSELIIMRTAGVTPWQIALAVLSGALIILLIVTGIGEGIGPSALLKSDRIKTSSLSGGQALSNAQGIWVRQGDTFVYINTVESNRKLKDVRWFRVVNQQLNTIGLAKTADFVGDHWQLADVAITHLQGMQRTQSQHITSMPWNISIKPALLNLSRIDPIEMSLLQLHHYISYRKENALQASNYELIFWQRIFQPLATVIIILLAIPFIFGPLRSVSMGLRVMTGIAIGLVFYFCNQLFGPLSMVYQLPPFWSATIPVIVFSAIAAYWLVRLRY